MYEDWHGNGNGNGGGQTEDEVGFATRSTKPDQDESRRIKIKPRLLNLVSLATFPEQQRYSYVTQPPFQTGPCSMMSSNQTRHMADTVIAVIWLAVCFPFSFAGFRVTIQVFSDDEKTRQHCAALQHVATATGTTGTTAIT